MPVVRSAKNFYCKTDIKGCGKTAIVIPSLSYCNWS